jgi:thiosulfate/3-mercaptopyruvate sulfurtransferase
MVWAVLCSVLCACNTAKPRVEDLLPEGPLMTVKALDSLLKVLPDAIFVVDVRTAEEYKAGHIPQALNVWRPALADGNYPYSSITATKAQLEIVFGEMGLRQDAAVVVYDGKMNADAANLWWIMQLAGKNDVKLLDGGLTAWQKAGLPVSNETKALTATDFHFPIHGDSTHLANSNHIRQALYDSNTVLIDTRTFEEYTGQKIKDGAQRGGHIPGSIWMDYVSTTVEKEGCIYLKPLPELEAMFQSKGVTKDKNIICYCHSGVRSAHTTFVLTALLGYPNVRNYDGSWEEWSYQASLPIATGANFGPNMIP